MKNIRFKKIGKQIAVTLLMCLAFSVLAYADTKTQNGNTVLKWNNISGAWKELMTEYRTTLAGIAGFGTLTSFLVFMIHMIRLATMPSHPIKRRAVFAELIVSAITTALLGGITIVLALFYTTIMGK